jgi:hypothetical protein
MTMEMPGKMWSVTALPEWGVRISHASGLCGDRGCLPWSRGVDGLGNCSASGFMMQDAP